MSKIVGFFVFICSLVWIAIGAMVAWSAYPRTVKNITLTSPNGVEIHIDEAKYSKLFGTIKYTKDGVEYTIDAKQYIMSVA